MKSSLSDGNSQPESRRRPFSVSPLSLQIGAYLAIGLFAVVASVMISRTALSSSEDAAGQSNAAILLGRVEINTLRLQDRLNQQPQTLASDALLALASERVLRQSLASAAEAASLVDSPEIQAIVGLVQSTQDDFLVYLATPSASNAEAFGLSLEAVISAIDTAQPQLTSLADVNHASLDNAIRWALAANLAVVFLAFGFITLTAVRRARSLQLALGRAEGERESLAEVTRGLNRKNEQLGALYQIVTEVTDTLSLRYVVETTVDQAKTLVSAELVVLRLLEAEKLEVAGVAGEKDQADRLQTVTLGNGITGRVAKRGKPVKVDEDAQSLLSAAENVPWAESGLVVPLIVGARVVGTIGCWSSSAKHFSEDDQRILEMMASQVATAVVAAELHEHTEHRAHHDPLTGMPNRHQLAEDSAGSLKTLIRDQEDFAVAMLDIDGFKHFNDDHGHHVGDVTLQKVAQVLESSLRDVDRVYRYGGEEFLIIFSSAGEGDAVAMAERLRRAVEMTPLTGADLEPVGPITVSLGVACHPRDGNDLDDLIRLADAALLEAKRQGRNRVVMTPNQAEAA